jgi:hypothetical protein
MVTIGKYCTGSWVVGRYSEWDTVATFMIIVKSPGNGLIYYTEPEAGGQREGGGLYGKRIKRRKQIKSLSFSSSLKEPSQQIV